jgi:hypothetical protein
MQYYIARFTIHVCLSICPFFQDVNAATAVHHTLQGAVIPSSGRGGMRIQYPLPFFKKNL